jgi:hypothetical protein
MATFKFNNAGAWKFINRYASYLTNQDTYTPSAEYIAYGSQTSPYIHVYSFNASSGYGSKYSNPSVGLSFYGQDLQFSTDKSFLVSADYSSPRVHAWKWSSAGFGTKYSNPATLPTGIGYGASISESNNTIAVAHDTSPYISTYPFDYTNGFGTKYSDPASLPAGAGKTVKLTNSYIFIGHETTPFVAAYPFNASSGFGTKYANPSTIANYSTAFIEYNYNNNAVVYGGIGYGFAYPWSASGFGTKYINPAQSLYSYGGQFNRKGDLLFLADDSYAARVLAYTWLSGFGTKYSDPATLPVAGPVFNNAGAMTEIGDAVAMLTSTSPYVQGYPFSKTTGFGTKYSNPATAFPVPNTGIAFG